jgi:hypothetical protein
MRLIDGSKVQHKSPPAITIRRGFFISQILPMGTLQIPSIQIWYTSTTNGKKY